jgi:hypothetical protein
MRVERSPSRSGRVLAVVLAAAITGSAACTEGETTGPPSPPPGPADIVVDTDDVAVANFGGFGAEWDPYAYSQNPAVPPSVKDRIAFMRLPFVRVRMFASWFAGVDDHYDFSNMAIRPLYDILDAAKANGTEVFLTEWGSDDWSMDPWPIDDPRYARAVADGLDHFINARGYTNIRYVAIVNEPDINTTYTQWSAGIVNLHRALAATDLLDQVRVTGPDICCEGAPWYGDGAWLKPSLADLVDEVTAWDRHWYPELRDVRAGRTEAWLRSFWDQVRSSDPDWTAKPLILGEIGFNTTWDQSTPGFAVDMADYAIQATRAGTSMVSAWQLDDESYPGGLDGEPPKWFGMWSTRDSGSELKPWFYTWSLLSRLVRPGSTLYLATQPARIRALAARDPSTGDWTFVLVNRQPNPARTVTVKVPGYGDVTYRRYLFDGMDGSGPRDQNGFPIPIATGQSGDLGTGITLTIPGNGVAFVTASP